MVCDIVRGHGLKPKKKKIIIIVSLFYSNITIIALFVNNILVFNETKLRLSLIERIRLFKSHKTIKPIVNNVIFRK